MPTDFITYAQNAEDVMLWRALQHVERGFYIDVGAQDPVIDSVTKAFYERGWHGINIEPVEHWHQRLVEDRPHDINLRVAVSGNFGEKVLFDVEDTGLSTFDPAFAKRYAERSRTVHEVLVRCRPLDDICAEYNVTTVHFLKIDCEGGEKEALEGFSLTSVRPWIILVEATEPNSTAPTHMLWEHMLISRGYGFVYFDGLNRFYVAKEHGELRSAFTAPPSPTEWKERAGAIFAQRRIDDLSEQLAQLRSVDRLSRTESERDHWRQQAEYWLNENSRRESALSELHGLVAVLRQEARDRSSEIARLQSEAAATLKEMARLQREVAALMQQHAKDEQAVRDLQSQLAGSIDRIYGLEREIAGVYASRSWALTAPLRGGRRIVAHATRRSIRTLLRPCVHAMRPALRRLAHNRVLRKLVVATLGHDSRTLDVARLFLFGAPPKTPPENGPDSGTEVSRETEPTEDLPVFSQRQRRVLKALHEAGLRGSTEERHSPCA